MSRPKEPPADAPVDVRVRLEGRRDARTIRFVRENAAEQGRTLKEQLRVMLREHVERCCGQPSLGEATNAR